MLIVIFVPYSYQINAQTELAIRYNDISPLENHHAAVAFEVIGQVFKNSCLLVCLNKTQDCFFFNVILHRYYVIVIRNSWGKTVPMKNRLFFACTLPCKSNSFHKEGI